MFVFAQWLLGASLAVDVVRTADVLVIDGRLDEPAWATAVPVTDFVRYAPTVGGAPPGATEVRFLQDGERLYIGVRVEQGRPIRYRMAPREDVDQDDQIGVFLDTFGQGHAGYVFYFNPLGVQQDIRVSSGRWSFDWDAVLDAAGEVDGETWTVEVALPFASIKYPAGSGPQEWDLILERIDVADQSRYSYPVTERDRSALWGSAEPLRVEPPRRGSGLEVIPSLTAVTTGSKRPPAPAMVWTDLDRPFEVFRPSLDLRFGVTPNVGVTGTVNPDFSQVETDETPIELNQRFAFWFAERRPFFLDGADLFQDRAELLYTRSIVEPVAGVKVAGKEGPVSVAVLHALDRSPAPSVHERGAPGFEPRDLRGAWAADTVARASVEAFGDGTIGLSFADKRVIRVREGVGSQGVHDAASVDAYVPFAESWVVAGSVTGSRTADGDGPALHGVGGEATIGRESGVGTGGFVAAQASTPGLRLETGYHPQSGFAEVEAALDHTVEPGWVDTLRPSIGGEIHAEDDHGGWAYGEVEVEVERGTHATGGFAGYGRQWEERVRVDGGFAGAWYWGRPTGWLALNPSIETSRALDYQRFAAGQETAADLTVTLWPTRHVRLDTSVALRWFDPVNDALERSARVRTRLGYQFSRTLGARLLGEYTTGAQAHDGVVASALVTWLLHPGTGVWVGYAESGRIGRAYGARDRTAFAKVSVLLRPRRRAE